MIQSDSSAGSGSISVPHNFHFFKLFGSISIFLLGSIFIVRLDFCCCLLFRFHCCVLAHFFRLLQSPEVEGLLKYDTHEDVPSNSVAAHFENNGNGPRCASIGIQFCCLGFARATFPQTAFVVDVYFDFLFVVVGRRHQCIDAAATAKFAA